MIGGGIPRTLSSRDLFGGQKLVIVRHEQDDYRLQMTAAGKLLLTK
jgi:hemin uptake protein HemP